MRRTAVVLLSLVFLAGCGDDDSGNGNGGGGGGGADAKGAETTVREYLQALVDKDGATACSKFTPAYQREVVRMNAPIAKANNADNCTELLNALTKGAGSVTFEGQKLTDEVIGKLKLNTSVRKGGQESNATVTGSQGLQRYELVTSEGKWLIAEITRGGGSSGG